MQREVAEFVIYIINEIANQKGCSTSEVYQALARVRAIEDYLALFYDVLHTMDSRQVVEDTLVYAQKRGVAL